MHQIKMNINATNLNDYYRTSDLSLAAVICLYFPLESIDKTNPSKAVFLFKREEELDELTAAYWRQELKVIPQAFFNQLKILKTRLYSGD